MLVLLVEDLSANEITKFLKYAIECNAITLEDVSIFLHNKFKWDIINCSKYNEFINTWKLINTHSTSSDQSDNNVITINANMNDKTVDNDEVVYVYYFLMLFYSILYIFYRFLYL